jgi:hypothetical protein
MRKLAQQYAEAGAANMLKLTQQQAEADELSQQKESWYYI